MKLKLLLTIALIFIGFVCIANVSDSIVTDTAAVDTLLTSNTSSVVVEKQTTEKINYAALFLAGIVVFGGVLTGLVKNIKYLSTTIPAVILALVGLYNNAVNSGGLNNVSWQEIALVVTTALLGIFLPGVSLDPLLDFLKKILANFQKKQQP